jgi:methyl-accepting chemotaxis protein
MKTPFALLEALSRSLKLRKKFQLLFLVSILPGAAILISSAIYRSDAISTTNAEIQGIEAFRIVNNLFKAATLHRRNTRAQILDAGNGEAETKRQNAADAIEKAMAELQPLLAPGRGPDLLNEISAHWQTIKRDWRNWQMPENDAEHARLVGMLEHLRYFIAGSSTLLLDPAANAYYQIDLATNKIPAMRRQLVQIRETFDRTLNDNNYALAWERWSRLDANIRFGLREFAANVELIQSDDANVATLVADWIKPVDACVAQTRDHLKSVAGSPITPATVKQTAGDISTCLDIVDAFSLKLIDNIGSKVLPDRLAHDTLIFWLNLLGGGLLLLIGSSFVLIFGNDLTRRGEHLKKMIVAMQDGDFSEVQPIPAADEIGEAAALAHRMRARWTDVVMGLRGQATLMLESSSGMDDKATVLAGNSLRQRDDAVQIANEVTKLSAGIENIAGDTENVLSYVKHASEVATRSAGTIENVTTEIRNLAATVNLSEQLIADLDQRVSKIDEIVVAIREISDKTNLLALNAAIEAARAGEAGRGFAVVADEVRTLAGITGESTQRVARVIKEIRNYSGEMVQMVSKCADQARTAVTAAATATADMRLIHEAATNSADKVESISRAIVGQRENASVVSSRVKDVAEMSTSSAAMTSDVSESSKSVDRISKAIYKEASYFRINNGDAVTMF